MKDNLVSIKKKFEERCDEFKKQMLEFKNNNEICNYNNQGNDQ